MVYLEDSVMWYALDMGISHYLSLTINERINYKQSYFDMAKAHEVRHQMGSSYFIGDKEYSKCCIHPTVVIPDKKGIEHKHCAQCLMVLG